jgi:hypothetical protein
MIRALPLLCLLAACPEYEVMTDLREQVVDQWFTVEGVRSDILFYADTSSSMERELAILGRSVDEFTARIEENSTDWQIATVTGPEGCSTEGILTPDTPGWQDLFAQGIKVPGGDDVDEWGLFNVFKAILESAPGGCNEGFVREGASLHVIFLSDEDDNSPGWELGGEYWQDYVDPILYIKDDPAQVRFSAVAGPVPDGCEGADPGLGYSDAVAATGGEFLSICDEWIDDIGMLADASISQSVFPLDWEPFEGTTLVEVDSVERPTGWVLETGEAGPQLRFTEDPPGAWAEVHIRYRALVEVEVTRPVGS